MKYGPDQIVACPHCSGLARHRTLLSANNFRVRVWTDCKRIEPMWPSPPPIVRCHVCKEFYWLADAKKIGTVGDCYNKQYKADPAWANAKDVEEPTEDDYYTALENGFAGDRQQEKYLRILAWWRSNDFFRDIHEHDDIYRTSAAPEWLSDDSFQETKVEISANTDAIRKNLKALLTLLNETDENDCIMIAEAHRELGEFESARKFLAKVRSNKYTGVVSRLLSLCDANCTRVAVLEI